MIGNVIVSTKEDSYQICDIFKLALGNIINWNGSNISTKNKNVSEYYEKYKQQSLEFNGTASITGPYYDDFGNSTYCMGVYVIGVYSETIGDNIILDKEITIYFSDKQLLNDAEGENTLIRHCDSSTVVFDNSYYSDKTTLIEQLKTSFSKISSTCKFSYISNTHYMDTMTYVDGSFNEECLCAKFIWNQAYDKFNKVFNVDPRYLDKNNNTYYIRPYDTALFTFDDLNFGVCNIFLSGFSVGECNVSAGDAAFSTGVGSKAMGAFSCAIGRKAITRNYAAMAVGLNTNAIANSSFACGDSSTSSGYASFTSGTSIANGNRSAAFNTSTATGQYSFSEGYKTEASGSNSHAEGNITKATGTSSHAEGHNTTASGSCSHAEGFETKAIGTYSHAEGYSSTASANYSHAEGYSSTSLANYSHTEGIRNKTETGGNNADRNVAQHAEGVDNIATGRASHIGGEYCKLSLNESNNSPDRSFVHGYNLKCSTSDQVVFGKYNSESENATFVIGAGTSDTNRKNIFEVHKNGETHTETLYANTIQIKTMFNNTFEVCADGSLRVPIFTAVPIPGSNNKQLIDTGKRAGIWITTKVEGNRDPKNADDIEILYNVVK